MLAVILIASFSFSLGLANPGNMNYATFQSLNPFVITDCPGKGYPDAIYDNNSKSFWVYHVCVDPNNVTTQIDAHSSLDLKDWVSHEAVLSTTELPEGVSIVSVAAVSYNNSYYLFFSATSDFPDYEHVDGDVTSSAIYVAKSNKPEGPFANARADLSPLLSSQPHHHSKRSPTDNPSVLVDENGLIYLYYTSGRSIKVVELDHTLANILDGRPRDVTPVVSENKETPTKFSGSAKIFMHDKKYYMIWRDSDLADPDNTFLSIRYAIAPAFTPGLNSVFVDKGKVLTPDHAVATTLGHATVIKVPESDVWYLVYSRRSEMAKNSITGLAYDRMSLTHKNTGNDKSYSSSHGHAIEPVKMGVADDFNHNTDDRVLKWHEFSFNTHLVPMKGYEEDDDDTFLHSQAVEGHTSYGRWIMIGNFSDMTYDIDLDVLPVKHDTGDAGVVFRVANMSSPNAGLYPRGPDNYWGYYAGIRLDDGSVIFGRANGTWKKLQASAPSSVDLWNDTGSLHHMRVWAKGAHIKVYVDNMDMPLIDIRDETYATGLVGMRSYLVDAVFDNVKIAKLSGD